MAEIDLKIKKAVSEDLETIAALAEEIWMEHYTPIIGEAQVRYMLDQFQSKAALEKQLREGYLYFLAFCDGVPCGYAGVVWESDKRTVFLSKLYVKSEHRRRGISRAMLQAACEEYADYERIYLTVNKNNSHSIDAYRRLGFEITKSVVSDIGNGYVMDDYVMTMYKGG